MKIKTKKKMNLPQLIEWAYHEGSDIRDEKIKSESMTVTFSEIGTPHIETKFHFLQVDELFTVEVEEEITEDTVIPKMIRIYEKDCLEDSLGYQRISIVENFSIGFELNRARSRREEIKTIHIVNEDYTHTLIWRDGKLVE
ncbi:hypothetical protein P1A29_02230 [Staphylococcus equorum]|uniref:hypothetical protein n=1 Tax=Staphylococcus equorum TaxID=246432 RepID=UPI002553D756|nr:hypothetical protein [Staphylococcus equorum]MDK9859258.1 hypothetical protein [Staphylococcus equorum]